MRINTVIHKTKKGLYFEIKKNIYRIFFKRCVGIVGVFRIDLGASSNSSVSIDSSSTAPGDKKKGLATRLRLLNHSFQPIVIHLFLY